MAPIILDIGRRLRLEPARKTFVEVEFEYVTIHWPNSKSNDVRGYFYKREGFYEFLCQ